MAIRLDGTAVFRSIGQHPDVFAGARKEIDAQAVKILTKVFKARTFDVIRAREFYRALGEESFDLFLDAKSDKELQTVLIRLDKHHPELKTESAAWRRKRIRALADGAEPSPPVKKPRAAKPKVPPRAKPAGRQRFKSAGMVPGKRPADEG